MMFKSESDFLRSRRKIEPDKDATKALTDANRRTTIRENVK